MACIHSPPCDHYVLCNHLQSNPRGWAVMCAVLFFESSKDVCEVSIAVLAHVVDSPLWGTCFLEQLEQMDPPAVPLTHSPHLEHIPTLKHVAALVRMRTQNPSIHMKRRVDNMRLQALHLPQWHEITASKELQKVVRQFFLINLGRALEKRGRLNNSSWLAHKDFISSNRDRQWPLGLSPCQKISGLPQVASATRSIH